jgi:hypothetical protein
MVTIFCLNGHYYIMHSVYGVAHPAPAEWGKLICYVREDMAEDFRNLLNQG